MKKFHEVIPLNEEGFNALFDHATPGIIITDENGRIILSNTGVEKLLGYNKHELIGRSRELLFPPELQPREQPATDESQFIARHKDGHLLLVASSRSYARIQEENIFVLYITRSSESHSSDKLQSCYSDIEQFTHATSHELREPLIIISEFSELLRRHFNGVHDETTQQYIQFITSASGKILNRVKSLQDYLLLGHDRKVRKVNCNQLVKEVLDSLIPQLHKNHSSVYIDPLPTVIGDASEIRQLFSHLISNAIKFASADFNPVISINVSKQKNYWQFAVSDNGIGIEKKYWTRIFSLFQQLHLPDKYEGYGIGLAYCKKIVELHEGYIWLDSTVGKGTTFYFTIKGSDEDKW